MKMKLQAMVHFSEEEKKILHERAALLGQELLQENTQTTQLEILEFKVDGERYGVESSYVSQICLLKHLTFLPGVFNYVRGIINVHGCVIPVIDIKKLFDLTEKEMSAKNVIVLSYQDSIFGLLADNILGIWHIPPDEIQPGLPTLAGRQTEFLQGVTDTQLTILDVHKLSTIPIS